MLVELKNGETLNGHLVNCDTWMNLTLKEVVQTSPVCLSSRCATPFARSTTKETKRGADAGISLNRKATSSYG